MMLTGMCAADVSAAEKKTVTDYQAYAAMLTQTQQTKLVHAHK
jgi:pullulanase